MLVHQTHSDLHKGISKSYQTFQLRLKMCVLAQRTSGKEPDKLAFLFPLKNIKALWADNISFQEIASGFTGSTGNHLPKDKTLAELFCPD